ncbi:DUF3993 domain-containing protein [Pseudoneobacillus sp. C159]
MQKLIMPFLLITAIIIYFLPDSPQANEEVIPSREMVFQLLESAFRAQISLSEEDRSIEEINSILDPYFSKDYSQKFLDVNLHEENGKYFTYGTDFGEYYIPFFHYSEYTKIVIEPKEIYVFEYFPQKQQGPVGYDSHYEGILLSKDGDKWKISNYLMNQIPERIIRMAL